MAILARFAAPIAFAALGFAFSGAVLGAHFEGVESRPDFLTLVLVGGAAAAVLAWRRVEGARAGETARAHAWMGVAGASLCGLGVVVVLGKLGVPLDTSFPLFLGVDEERSLALATAWVPLPIAGFALASFFSPVGVLPARGFIQAVALAFLVLALHPSSGWAICASALLLSLVGADGLAGSTRTARVAAALMLAGWVFLSILPHDSPMPRSTPAVDPSDELVQWVERPGGADDSGTIRFACRLDAAVPFDRLSLAFSRLPDGSRVDRGDYFELGFAPGPAGSRAVDTTRLRPGWWRAGLGVWRLEADGADRLIGRRTAAVFYVPARWHLTPTMAFFTLAVLAVLLAPLGRARAWIAIALAGAQGLLAILRG